MNIFRCTFPAVGALALAASAIAGTPLKVEGGWVHSTVAGQNGAAAFMRLTAQQPLRLVGVASPVAGTADLHQMKREGDVMTMRPLAELDLPAGRTVELSTGGYHLMLQDLKQPLRPGSIVPLTLVLRDAKGVQSKLELKLPVAARAPAAAASMPGMGATDGHKH
jgi:copper(I)-binding protein